MVVSKDDQSRRVELAASIEYGLVSALTTNCGIRPCWRRCERRTVAANEVVTDVMVDESGDQIGEGVAGGALVGYLVVREHEQDGVGVADGARDGGGCSCRAEGEGSEWRAQCARAAAGQSSGRGLPRPA